jgi:hypothetical protein
MIACSRPSLDWHSWLAQNAPLLVRRTCLISQSLSPGDGGPRRQSTLAVKAGLNDHDHSTLVQRAFSPLDIVHHEGDIHDDTPEFVYLKSSVINPRSADTETNPGNPIVMIPPK